jgi:hypothetical protein
MRNNLKQVLGASRELARRAEELGEEEDVDASQDVLRAALARGAVPNLRSSRSRPHPSTRP